MGRGLSELQKNMLEMAYQNRQHATQPVKITYQTAVHSTSEKLSDITLRAGELNIPLQRTFYGYGFVVLLAGSFDSRQQADDLTIRLQAGGISEALTRVDVSGKYADLYAHQILESVYGFQERQPFYFDKYGDWHGRYDKRFSPKEIGQSEYQSAAAAVSRAIRRLEQRGLVVRRQGYPQGGFFLTPAGMELAQSLSVKTGTLVNVLTDSPT